MTTPTTFTGLLVTQTPNGVSAELTSLSEASLPPGEVLIRVLYSSLNYKDALAICRGAPVVRKFPMVPGVDIAGSVVNSEDSRFRPGDNVLVTGSGLGETRWGGYAQYARVPSETVQLLPTELDAATAMTFGTAGFTAMLCLMALERGGLTPSAGPVLVTGASGGVGSFAISLLVASGYTVAASTAKTQESDYLKALGASEIIDRATLSAPGKPLQSERWAAAVDSVGGHTLANVCAAIRYGGAVAACGLAGGMDFPTTVAPFILRGVTLYGIDSVRAPLPLREAAWRRLASGVSRDRVNQIGTEIPLTSVAESAKRLLDGKIRGRLVVKLS